jgi:hypothetical protein
VGVIVRRDDECGMTVKWNDDDRWSSNEVVLWLRRRQNRDTIDWWGERSRLRWHFYSSGGCESGGPGKGGQR